MASISRPRGYVRPLDPGERVEKYTLEGQRKPCVCKEIPWKTPRLHGYRQPHRKHTAKATAVPACAYISRTSGVLLFCSIFETSRVTSMLVLTIYNTRAPRAPCFRTLRIDREIDFSASCWFERGSIVSRGIQRTIQCRILSSGHGRACKIN